MTNKLSVFCKLTKPLFSLFSIPFLLTQVELAYLSASQSYTHGILSGKMLSSSLIALFAFFCARSTGMIVNSAIDSNIDAKNPRTAGRAIPQKLISKKRALLWAFCLSCCFLTLASMLGRDCLIMSSISLLFIVVYPYTKYLSVCCHFFLGSIYTLAMLTASIIIKHTISLSDVLFGITALLIIAANDITYALQDIAFDRRENLHSIPAKWGREASHTLTQVLQISAYVTFLLLGVTLTLPSLFFILSLIPLSAIAYTIVMQKKSSEQNLYKTFVLSNIIVPLSFLIAVTLFIIG